jgi:excisionase family DNA binding protein
MGAVVNAEHEQSKNMPGRSDAHVRGVLAERVIVSTTLDPFLSLKALAAYSGLSVRKLRDCIDEPTHSLPCYRIGGKILIRRSEFDAWITVYRRTGREDLDRVVGEALRDLRTSK